MSENWFRKIAYQLPRHLQYPDLQGISRPDPGLRWSDMEGVSSKTVPSERGVLAELQ